MLESRTLWLALACAGCGRIGFDPSSSAADAGGDASLACTPGPWGPLRHQDALATGNDEWEAALHPDGLVVVFTRQSAGVADLMIASRATLADDFGAPSMIANVDTADLEFGSTWSPDGKQLYWRFDSMAGSETRVADYFGGTNFSPPRTADLPDGFSWELTPDQLEVYYTTSPANMDFDLHHAVRASIGAPWVTDDSVLGSVDRVGSQEGWPTYDAARDTLYIEYQVGSQGVIAELERSGTTFGPPTTVPDLASANSDGDPELSPDGMTLLFDSVRLGGAGANDLYLTTRSCL